MFAPGRLGMVVRVSVIMLALALRPGRFDLHLADGATRLGRKRKHPSGVLEPAFGGGERRALRRVGRRMLEADKVVQRRDQLHLQHAALERHGQLGDAVLVGAMSVLRQRGGGCDEGEEAGENGQWGAKSAGHDRGRGS